MDSWRNVIQQRRLPMRPFFVILIGMDQELIKRLESLEQKIDATYVSAEKTRKYFLWTMIITLLVFFLPLIGLIFVLPMFLSSYLGGMEGLL